MAVGCIPDPGALGAPAFAADVRAANAADAAGMRACVEAAYSHYIPRIGKPPGPMLDDYAARSRSPLSFVATVGDRVVGVLVLEPAVDGLLLDNVAVHPDFAGQGLGRRLMALAEAETRTRGHTTLSLYTHEQMRENIALYARLGYVETERCEEQGYARVYMRKQLG